MMAASLRPGTGSRDVVLRGQEGREVLHEQHGGEQVEFQRGERRGGGDLVGCALGHEHPGHEEREAQQAVLSTERLFVAVRAVGGAGGD